MHTEYQRDVFEWELVTIVYKKENLLKSREFTYHLAMSEKAEVHLQITLT